MSNLSDILPYRQFLTDGVIDERGEGILVGNRIVGPSPDSNDADSLLRCSERVANALVHLRKGDAIQILFDRRPATQPPQLQYSHPVATLVMGEMRDQFTADEHWTTDTRAYFSYQFEAPTRNAIRAYLRGASGFQRAASQKLLVERALGRFRAFRDSLRDAVALSPMTNLEMFRDLRHAVAYDDLPVSLPDPSVRLNQVVGNHWQINGEKPFINGWHLRPLVLTAYPSETLPQMLAPLLEHRGHLTVSIRYRVLSPYDAQKALGKERDFWPQTLLRSFSNFIKRFLGQEQDDDKDAIAQIADINDAIATSQSGTPFGTVSVVAIVRDRDPDQADLQVSNLSGILAGQNIMSRLEIIGAAKAVRTTWPGHLMTNEEYQAQRYRLKLTGYNFGDLALPATYWEGQRPSPLVISGTAGVPFHFPFKDGNLGHILAIGKSGSGKSSWAGLCACSLLSIPDVNIAWLDLGRSSYVLAHLLGAEYHDVGADDEPPLCPLAMLDKPNGVGWLSAWFERLFYRRRQLELDEDESRRFRRTLLALKEEGYRELIYLHGKIYGDGGAMSKAKAIVKELCEDYGYIFNGVPVTRKASHIAVYEMANLTMAPKYIATPAKELILGNVMASLGKSPSYIIWDEFWDAIGDEVSAAWFYQAIRTMRRHNASFIGLTQSTVEILKSPDHNLLLANMPIKLFFPDTSAATPHGAEALYQLARLNPHEIARIASAQLGEFFYKSSAGARLASAWLGEVGAACCASTKTEHVEQAKRIFNECTNNEQFINAWLGAQGIHVPSTQPSSDGCRGGTIPPQHHRDRPVSPARNHVPELASLNGSHPVRRTSSVGATDAQPRRPGLY